MSIQAIRSGGMKMPRESRAEEGDTPGSTAIREMPQEAILSVAPLYPRRLPSPPRDTEKCRHARHALPVKW